MAPRLISRFSEMLGMLNKGTFERQCSEALEEAIQSLEEQPTEKGKATITIKIDLAYDSGMLAITPTVNSKLPTPSVFGNTIFWTHEGKLSTQHPSQIDLEEAIRDTAHVAKTA